MTKEDNSVKRIFTLGLFVPPLYDDREAQCIEILGEYDRYDDAAQAMETHTVSGDQYFRITEEHILENGERKFYGSWNHDGVRFRV